VTTQATHDTTTSGKTGTASKTGTADTTAEADNAAMIGARIIPFPVKATARAKADPRAQPTPDPQERLARALASLDSALSDQRAAMSGWRESLDHLRKATNGLGLSMQRYHRTLGKLGSDVSELHAEALRLERWADDTLAQTAAGPAPGPAARSPTTADAAPVADIKAAGRHE